jgi:hypothetical protein
MDITAGPSSEPATALAPGRDQRPDSVAAHLLVLFHDLGAQRDDDEVEKAKIVFQVQDCLELRDHIANGVYRDRGAQYSSRARSYASD